jgi:nucleoside-diphosphate-sugar epimerase
MEEPDLAEGLAVPGSPYAAAKWAGSAYGRMFHALYGLPVVVARIFMVYGPGQQDIAKLVPYVITNFLRGEVPVLGSGKRAIDWVYVEDVAEGLERACFADGIGGLTLDMGSGRQDTIRDVVESLAAIIQPPFDPVFGALADRPLDREPVADSGRTESILGWRATTPLRRGLEQTVRWYREHPQIYRWDAGASGLATPSLGPVGKMRPRRGN